MKKMFVLWGALALLTAACSNEESQEVSFSPLVLTAQQEGGEATRTSLSGTEVHWSAGDNVAAFVSNVAHTSTATEILSAKSARFTFSDLAADAVVQYAVYPAAAAAGLAGDVITVTVPTEQTAVAGSFAEGSAVAIAQGGSSTLGFKNVCGFLAFTINADDVQSVHIYANEKMTGTADINWNSGDPTVSAFGTFAYTGVKLTGPFIKGATYYAAVFPGTYTGLTLKLTHSDGYVSTYTNSNTLTVSRKDNVVIARNLVLRTPVSGTWFEKTPATIGSGVPVIIVGKVGGSYRLISNADTGASSSPSAATTATVSGSTVTDVDDSFDGYKWNLSTTDGKFTLYPAGVNTRWLNCQATSGSASQTCMAVDNESYFKRRFFIWDAAGHLVTSDSYDARYLSYNNGLWCGETFPASTVYPAAVFSFYVKVP
ncbi:hypothetical protein L6466_05615 [Prevotella communis]|uniref:hypothetical protein n=1 Tax=Prevotella communis TaxID=2913614 RepID=UPI001EDBA5B4|nr:hypothetical protein [Prevotella communis]UKK61200.1 hypothetical protein L6468_09310 [Prevotella communis]UKK64025.1 hypothetical protein L6473_09315 [Prevotella communis]UKK69024.1 hypothetical protein L6464_06865 [Prevotella communis]UKK71500.1 hypothetical protein L6466_05615 [Prevotella communis]